jgi:hypothetical protein
MMDADHHHIGTTFTEAVAEALEAVGDKTDHRVTARGLFIKDRIHVFEHGHLVEIENPHHHGQNRATLVDTIRRMRNPAMQ